MNERTPEELQKAEELLANADRDYRILQEPTNEGVAKKKTTVEQAAANRTGGAMNDPIYVGTEVSAFADTLGASELRLADEPAPRERNIPDTDNDPNSLNATQSEIAENKISGSTLENASLSNNTARAEANDPHNRTGKNFTTPKSTLAPIAKKTGFFGKLFGG